MKIELVRDVMNFDSLLIRITEFGMDKVLPAALVDEMGEAIKHFVATDTECQILINQMVRDAFKSVDLLSLVTEAVKKKVQAGAEPDSTKATDSENTKTPELGEASR